jgi:hypothetical protein
MSNCCPDTRNITSLELKTPIDLFTLNFQPNRCTIIKSDFEGLYAVIKKEEYDRLKNQMSGGDGNGGGTVPKCSNSSNLLWQIGFFSFLIIALILLVLFLVYFFKNKNCHSNKLK